MKPDIRIHGVEHGALAQAAALNRKIDPAIPILKVALEIHWEDPAAAERLVSIEAGLRRFSDTISHHQCRGLRAYRVFGPATEEGGAGHPRRQGDGAGPPPGFDAALALAHLIEHAIIDFQSFITGARRCSGVTGALTDPPGRFDLMVECPDPLAGRCALALAVTWLGTIASGGDLPETEKDLLAASRAVLRCPARRRTSSAIAGRLGWTERRADRALNSLCEMGCLGREAYAFNFSDIPSYAPLGA